MPTKCYAVYRHSLIVRDIAGYYQHLRFIDEETYFKICCATWGRLYNQKFLSRFLNPGLSDISWPVLLLSRQRSDSYPKACKWPTVVQVSVLGTGTSDTELWEFAPWPEDLDVRGTRVIWPGDNQTQRNYCTKKGKLFQVTTQERMVLLRSEHKVASLKSCL